MINPARPRPIRWEQFRKRSTEALLPMYYFRPYTIARNKIPSIRAYASLSFGPTNRQSLIDQVGFTRVQSWLVTRCLRQPETMSRQVAASHRLAAPWLAWCRKTLQPDRLESRSNRELLGLYRTYQRYYERYSMVNIIYWVFAGDRLIETLNGRLGQFIPGESVRAAALETLTTPSVFSFIQQEEWTFLRLARQTANRSRRWTGQQLERHSRRYGWIPWDYVGPTFWTPAILARRLRSLSLAKARHEFEHLRRYRAAVRSRQIRLIRTHRLPSSVVKLALTTQAQAILQDDKKAVTTEAHYYLHFLQRETARRLHQKLGDMYFFSFDEIAAAFHGQPLPDIQQRRHHCIIFIENGVLKPVHGRLADRWYATMERPNSGRTNRLLRGTPAAGGKASGRVKIVLLTADIRKVKRGDILVTQMTTPEFIPAMKKAAAFVTDEGGLTCHAAIVAREMKKPCIIGTKIATQVLNDGDRVEVDATKGVVRKI